MFLLLCLPILWACVISVPIDYRVKVDLPVYDDPQPKSNVHLAEALLPENHPGSDTLEDNSIISKKPVIKNFVYDHPAPKSVGLFAAPQIQIDSAVKETEGFGSKALSIKDSVHQAVAGILQPTPIVDSIMEEEKYGNDGDKFYKVGHALVGRAEGISNLINSIIVIPGSIIRSLTRTVAESLNHLGGKIVGL